MHLTTTLLIFIPSWNRLITTVTGGNSFTVYLYNKVFNHYVCFGPKNSTIWCFFLITLLNMADSDRIIVSGGTGNFENKGWR